MRACLCAGPARRGPSFCGRAGCSPRRRRRWRALGNQAEKDYTLALSVKLRSLLVARGIAVVTTRESDADCGRRAPRRDRQPRQCRGLPEPACGAGLLKSGSGVHLFVSSLPSGADTRFVPWKTAQAAWITRSLALAGVLNSALTHAGMAVTLGRTALPAIDSMACPPSPLRLHRSDKPMRQARTMRGSKPR